jgi:dolichol-phosphate mannosyltransferase
MSNDQRFMTDDHQPMTLERLDLSVLVPMYNEAENVAPTVAALREALEATDYSWEIVLVDDGSQDSTLELAKAQAFQDSRVRVLSSAENGGLGKAMKLGFRQVRGEVVATIDADLSYGPKDLLRVVDELWSHPEVDIVIGSPYMAGGAARGVPPVRLLISRVANRLIGAALNGQLSTTTGILRAYRQPVLRTIWLESDGPEINMEVLSKALTMGYRVREVPAILKARERGKSKLRFGRTTRTFLLFSLFEKPIMLFGLLGILMLALGVVVNAYLLADFFHKRLDPERPLMTVMMLLFLMGLQFFSFGFLGSQLATLRREVYRLQRQVGESGARAAAEKTQAAGTGCGVV